jgi:signal transduction histidine kinase
VSLRTEAEHTVLRVRDDGCGTGADQQIAHTGFGLRSMSERAAALGGELVARELVDGGTELEVPVR